MRASAWGVFTPIAIRILAFNVLIVFLPIAGMLSLGTYERQLLRALERSLVQQGRVLSASLEDSGPRLAQNANLLILKLRQRHDARLRIIDAKGRLLADSARFGTTEDISPSDAASPPAPRQAQETFLYRLASFPIRQWRRWVPPPVPPPESDEFYSGAKVLLGPEVKDASGRRLRRHHAGHQRTAVRHAVQRHPYPEPRRGHRCRAGLPVHLPSPQ